MNPEELARRMLGDCNEVDYKSLNNDFIKIKRRKVERREESAKNEGKKNQKNLAKQLHSDCKRN